MRTLTALILTVIACLTLSCSDPDQARRQFLLTEIQQMQNSYSVLSQEFSSQQQQVGFLAQKLHEQRQELADYQRRVKAYMMNHKMAIAAIAAGIGGAATAYDANNEFSDEVQGTAALVGFVAGLWALDNMNEVIEVGDQLMQADQYVKSLNSQIATMERQLRAARTPIPEMERKLSSLQQSYQAAKTEYESLL